MSNKSIKQNAIVSVVLFMNQTLPLHRKTLANVISLFCLIRSLSSCY